jgi:hypothetical protein
MMDMNFSLRLLRRGLVPSQFLVQWHRFGEVLVWLLFFDLLMMDDLVTEILHLIVARLQQLS